MTRIKSEMRRGKNKTKILLAGTLALTLGIASMTGADIIIGKDTAGEETVVKESMNYQILSEGGVFFEYDADGNCIEARNGDESIFFRYDYDDVGRKVARYAELGEAEQLLEIYAYNEAGYLEQLTAYVDPENPTIWNYDENGRATSVLNLPTVPENMIECSFMTFVWDEEGKLLERRYPSWLGMFSQEVLADKIAEQNDSINQQEAAAQIEEYLEKHEAVYWENGDIVLNEVKETYQYDEEGRIVHLQHQDIRYPIASLYIGGSPDVDSKVNTTDIFLEYVGDEQIDYYLFMNNEDAEAAKEDVDPSSFTIAKNDAGFPIGIGGNDDFYSNLSFEVESARIACLGFRWNDTMTHYWGEVNGGLENFMMNLSMLMVGGIFNLEITGKNSDGSEVRLLAAPDSLGRQMMMKFVDGKLTKRHSYSQMIDLKKSNMIYINDDSDEIFYK